MNDIVYLGGEVFDRILTAQNRRYNEKMLASAKRHKALIESQKPPRCPDGFLPRPEGFKFNS